MVNQTLYSGAVIAGPTTIESNGYCTEDEWRNFTLLTNQNDFPSSVVNQAIIDATEQIKKDGFYMIRYELVTKDSNNRYFTGRVFWGNRYGRNSKDNAVINGEITKYDIEVWEADVQSSVAAAIALQGTRVNRLMYRIPYDAITEVNDINGFFKLSSEYPTEGRQVYVTYWLSGKPLGELSYELMRACIEMVTILVYKKLKTRRLKKGTVQFTLGKQTVVRNEQEFDALVADHMKEYHKWIRWFKPFIGRRVKIGRMETQPGNFGGRVPLYRN